MVYTLECSQLIKAPMSEVWDFFSSPSNLSKITPARMNFVIKSIEGRMTESGMSYKMFQGQKIRYKVSVLPLVRLTWITEITRVEENKAFVDEQLKGPYTLWRHLHTFEETPEGVLMRDKVEYSIPFGFLGRLANVLFVAREVQGIFDYRFEIVEEIFHRKK